VTTTQTRAGGRVPVPNTAVAALKGPKVTLETLSELAVPAVVLAIVVALIAPMLLTLFAGIIDFARVFDQEIALSSAVASAAQYALLNAASINSGSAASLAATLSGIVANSNGVAWAGATVTGRIRVRPSLRAILALRVSPAWSLVRRCWPLELRRHEIAEESLSF